MALRKDLIKDQDYILVNTSSWLKLVSAFGGAPEIPIYQYTVEKEVIREDGSVVEKSNVHDLNPITVNLTAIEIKTKWEKKMSVLVSPSLTVKYFAASVVKTI